MHAYHAERNTSTSENFFKRVTDFKLLTGVLNHQIRLNDFYKKICWEKYYQSLPKIFLAKNMYAGNLVGPNNECIAWLVF